MAGWLGTVSGALRSGILEFARAVRRRGRSAAFRALRLTGATAAAFLVAQFVGLRTPPPLIAALTALLVVQATLTSTLVNGVQRVMSVVTGVALAVLFVSAVGLSWWSLAALVAASILVGQLLRLGPHLVEVPISAMLVLGVGASGAESVGAGRIVETLIGAAVGMFVNVVFPPAVQTRYATRAVQKFAGEIADLLQESAAALVAGPVTEVETGRWLDDARRLNRHAPRVDRALAHAEESRRLNVRALHIPPVGADARTGLDVLEHASVSRRTLFRAMDDATRERIGVHEDAAYADVVRRTAASLLERMSTAVRTFGDLLTTEDGADAGHRRQQLAASLAALHSGRELGRGLLIDDPRSHAGLWELNSALLTAVDRLLDELGSLGEAQASPRPSPCRARTTGRRPRGATAAVPTAARCGPPRNGSPRGQRHLVTAPGPGAGGTGVRWINGMRRRRSRCYEQSAPTHIGARPHPRRSEIMTTPRSTGNLPPRSGSLAAASMTDRLRALHDDFVEMVDMALAEGREDLVRELVDRYPDEALALMTAGAGTAR